MATISRWTSFTPPPNVLICAWRAVRSSFALQAPRPGEPGAQVAGGAPTIPSSRR